MSVAVYADAVYRSEDSQLFTDETFIVFVSGLRDLVDRLVLVGRLDPAPQRDAYALRDDVDFVALPFYRSLGRPWAAARSIAGSARNFWRVLGQVEVVWLLGPHPLAMVFALLTLLRRRRLVLGVRQDMPLYMRARYPTRRSIHVAAGLLEGGWRALARRCPTIVVGPDLARRYRRARSLLAIYVSVVDDGDVVSPDEVPARSYDGDIRVLSVGRLDPEKNPLLLADVLARLREADPRWRLVVCGDGVMADELRTRLQSSGLDNAADLLGFRPLGELQGWYKQSHVLLHVSWTEGVPQVLFEAFAAGLPVVATDVGGVGEAAAGAAVLVPPGDPTAAAEAVRRVAADEVLRADLVLAGLDIARRHTAGAERARVAAVLTGTSSDIRAHSS